MLRRLARRAARARTIATKPVARKRAERYAAFDLAPIRISAARRIAIIGPAGSGKTWLATRLAGAHGWPVHHLDDVGHVAGGGSPLRDAGILRTFTDQLAGGPVWICEGVDIGWTEPAFAQADLIIWLDEGGIRPALRMVRRFVQQGVAEAGHQRGWRRFLRFRDYARRLRQLIGTLGTSTRYGRSPQTGIEIETRASVAAALTPHADRVLRLRSPRERARAIRLLVGPGG
ncbi:MAG: hypothetical protein ABI622_06925 [Chloroflexota bacterium]